jgi:hypothetical protein
MQGVECAPPRPPKPGVHGGSPPSSLTSAGPPHTCGTHDLISQKVFIQSFCKSQFPHKSVYLFFVLVMVEDTLTDLWGS